MSAHAAIRRIILTGFMGAGKSTIGPMLARPLGWDFIDADTSIESRAGMKIAEVFAKQGEPAFREREAQIIQELSRREKLVLALGGGALEMASTREFLSSLEHSCIVFLDAPLDVLVSRCLAQPNAAERPVLADREGLLRRFETRLQHYRRAHVTISTAGLAPQEIVNRILQQLENRCSAGASAESVPAR